MEQEEIKKVGGNKILIYLVVAVVVIAVGVGVYYLLKGGSDGDSSSTSSSSKSFEYDGKVVQISSVDGKVTGQMAISRDNAQEYPISVVSFMKISDDLPKIKPAVEDLGESYFYIASHVSSEDLRNGSGTGALSAAFCNIDTMPDVLELAKKRTVLTDTYEGCEAQYDPWHDTNTFYHTHLVYYGDDTFDYDRLLNDDVLAIFDQGPFYVSDGESGYGVDAKTVIAEGEIAAQYELIYTE